MRKTIIGALLAVAAVLPAAVPAAATSGSCPRSEWQHGDRLCTQAGNRWVLVQLHVQRRDGHDHARGDAMIPERGSVWLDVDHSGHTSRTHALTVRPGSTAAHGGSSRQQTTGGWQYDGPGYRVRACASYPGHGTVCTAWH
ncbi:hypothetical protein [Streptomyces sp. DW26H14]|uniref:hypothetical protein n=1 Tax=Streptomyces sp. DW26H14 TaxID=3435395 RepID=UPI00403E0039